MSRLFTSEWNTEAKRFECVTENTSGKHSIAHSSCSLEAELLASRLNTAYQETVDEIGTVSVILEAK